MIFRKFLEENIKNISFLVSKLFIEQNASHPEKVFYRFLIALK